MIRVVQMPVAVEPTQWNVVFHPVAATPWMNRLPIGRFKHVSAFAYLAGLKGWLIYDVQMGSTRIIVLPDLDASMQIIGKLTDGCDILSIDRREGGSTGGRLGFWCVPAVKHLIGIRSGALRPDRLYDDLLLNGAKVIHVAPRIQSAGRSERGSGGEAGRERQDCRTASHAEG